MSSLPNTGKVLVNEKIAELSVRGALDQHSSKASKKRRHLSTKQKRRAKLAKHRGEVTNDILRTKIEKATHRYQTVKKYRKDDTPDVTKDNEKYKKRNIFMSLLMEEDRENQKQIEQGLHEEQEAEHEQ